MEMEHAKSGAADYSILYFRVGLGGATSLKILSGGWVPLLIGAIAVTI
jgi:K+ transporter